MSRSTSNQCPITSIVETIQCARADFGRAPSGAQVLRVRGDYVQVIDLAHRFGSAAVAEGIESQVELQALMAMGCDFGQGALIAPAMPQEQFLELLLRRLNGPGASADDEGSAQGARALASLTPRVA